MTWWQQVAHLSDRYTCIAFSHRGYPPSSEIGIPDPSQYAGDLAALIEDLQLPDVRLVAQSMGGWTCLEYVLQDPRKVRALVLTSTCGSIDRASIPLANRQTFVDRHAAGHHRGIGAFSKGTLSSAGYKKFQQRYPCGGTC